MKTENTLRTARNSLLCIFTALAASFLVACGSDGGGGFGAGGGGGGGGGGDAGNGTFHASDWVVGLDYTGNGGTGKTGAKGVFSFEKGQTVAFSIGEVPLGDFVSDADEDFVTPTRIASGTTVAINIERLLIALDSDESLANGTIALNARSATDAMTVWSVLTATTLATVVSVVDSDGATVEYPVPSNMRASILLANTNNCGFSGAFEGKFEGQEDGVDYEGDHAAVWLAFGGNKVALSNPLTVNTIDSVIDAIETTDTALYINLWKEGGSSETPVTGFGGDSGALAINLDTFPVTRVITETEMSPDGMTVDVEMTTLRLESYGTIAYESTTRRAENGGASTVYATESGYYRRVASGDIRDADYRIAGFYSDAVNRETPQEAEIGIYAFSANKGPGSVRPYVGWFSSPIAGDDSDSVYSNIGEGGLSSRLYSYAYTGTPEDNGMMTLTDTTSGSDRVIIAEFTEADGDVGYGTFSHPDPDPDSGGSEFDLSGGWCAL